MVLGIKVIQLLRLISKLKATHTFNTVNSITSSGFFTINNKNI